MVPLRYVTRNRWWTLAWAAGICLSAAEFAKSHAPAQDTNQAAPADGANQMDAVAAALR